ncbi:hypothetical protein TrLO_g7231 [Triparma laevis f. longispina]|uniref:Uncharacterized protein n=1 Tax=Triparma laevis f. longispina TaxID=1714387 RepID=A0A9W7DS56_9STRA|nr:hypothetical protein TrLO_g7231 [Triparma laevis f. longispina]
MQILQTSSSFITNALRTDESPTSSLQSQFLQPPVYHPPTPSLAKYNSTTLSPVPQLLTKLYPTTEVCSLTGYLKHLRLTFSTIDSNLYLFPPEGTDFISYTGLTQVITSVTECKPQTKTFTDAITHTIIVTTPTEIHVLAVTRKANFTQETNVIPTNIILPLVNPVTCVAGSALSGRVLAGDSRGDIFEVVYTTQQTTSWASTVARTFLNSSRSKARKINHTTSSWVPEIVTTIQQKFTGRGAVKEVALDDERGLGWGLWKDGTVEAFDMKIGGNVKADSGFGETLKTLSSINLPNLMTQYLTLMTRSSSYSNTSSILIHTGSLPAVGGSAGARALLKTLPCVTFDTLKIVPNVRSNAIFAWVGCSNGLEIYLACTATQVKIAHVKCPLDSDYKPTSAITTNLYINSTSTEIPFTGNLNSGASSHVVGDGSLVVSRSGNGNYVYCRSFGNVFSVQPIGGDICDVVEIPIDDSKEATYIDTLNRRSKTPNDAQINKVFKSEKVSQPIKISYHESSPDDDKFFYKGGDFATLKYFTGGAAVIVSRGGSRRIALESRRDMISRGLNENTLKDIIASAKKTQEVGDVFSELFALAVSESDGRRVISKMFEQSNSPKMNEGRVEYSWVAEGLSRFVSRCLRPVWFKAVVEANPLKKGKDGKVPPGGSTKILISGATLDKIRAPLFALQNLLKTFFLPAVSTASASIAKSKSNNDNNNANTGAESVLTRTMIFYNATNNTNPATNSAAPSSTTTNDNDAKRAEEQCIHSLYRLVSRAVQALSLIDLLTYAHELEGVPGVDWGALSGATFKAWVVDREVHEVIKSVLTGITSYTRDANSNNGDFESDKLANALSHQCYLYFSSGDRLSYEGFKLCSTGGGQNAGRAGVLLRKAARFWKSANVVCAQNSSFDRAIDALFNIRAVEGIVDVTIATAANFGGTVKGSGAEDDEGDASVDVPGLFEWEQGIYSGVGTGTGGSTSEDARKKCYAVMIAKLHSLIDLREDEKADQLIGFATYSHDEMLHEALYSDLLATGEAERLIRINSPRLEAYLSRHDLSLLWRFYVVHNRPNDACVLMTSRGLSKERIPIDERVASFSRALQFDDGNSELRERLEVAALQRQVLSSISELVKEGTVDASVEDEIRYRLLDLSELYNDVCGPYTLWADCLSILLVSGMQNIENVELLWKALICDSLADDCENEAVLAHLLNMREGVPSRPSSSRGTMFESGEWIASVKNVVVSTGRNLWGRGGDYTVPLKMLIFELEGLRRCWAAIGKTSENFVIQVFLDIGVAPLDILDGYLATLTDREALGADKLERLHYIRGICEILQVVVREHSSANLRKIIDNVISQTESLVVVGSQHAGEVENLLEVLKQFEGRVR